MISNAKIYQDNQGMERTPDDNLQNLVASLEMSLITEEDHEQTRQNNVQKRKQKRVRDLLKALNKLSADLFATIRVAERQIVVLQDLHSVFLASYRTKTRDYEKGYPLRRNPFDQNTISIPILSEHPEQIWPNTLDTIDEVVRKRKSFIKRIRDLVENMDIRRKIVQVPYLNLYQEC